MKINKPLLNYIEELIMDKKSHIFKDAKKN